MIDLQEATHELKSSTDDREIQALTAPEQVGGHVGVLLGIQYNTIPQACTFPGECTRHLQGKTTC